jgi:hypothetical protein
MASVTTKISVVELSNNMKTPCALHVINKYDTILFTSSTAAAVTKHIKKQQLTSVER